MYTYCNQCSMYSGPLKRLPGQHFTLVFLHQPSITVLAYTRISNL